MFGITDIATYFLAVLVIIALPGPNSLYCLSVSAAFGRAAGWRALTGILVGDTVLIIATVLGAGTLLRLYPALFHGIKLVGGLYLAFIGIKLLIGAYYNVKNRAALSAADIRIKAPKSTGSGLSQYFYRSLGLSLSNPKAILFFLSFFVQFVDPDYHAPFISFLVLALIVQAVSFSYLTLLVFSGRKLAEIFAKRPVMSAFAMLMAGGLFIGFAVNLWMAELI